MTAMENRGGIPGRYTNDVGTKLNIHLYRTLKEQQVVEKHKCRNALKINYGYISDKSTLSMKPHFITFIVS